MEDFTTRLTDLVHAFSLLALYHNQCVKALCLNYNLPSIKPPNTDRKVVFAFQPLLSLSGHCEISRYSFLSARVWTTKGYQRLLHRGQCSSRFNSLPRSSRWASNFHAQRINSSRQAMSSFVIYRRATRGKAYINTTLLDVDDARSFFVNIYVGLGSTFIHPVQVFRSLIVIFSNLFEIEWSKHYGDDSE